MNLNQVTVYSKDFKKAVKFYQKLGLLLIIDSIPRYARFECPDSDSTFSLHETDETSNISNIVLYFEPSNLGKKISELKQKSIKFEPEPTDQTWLWREAHLQNLDNNKNNEPRYAYWGLDGNHVVSGDYDGDGLTDFAVWKDGIYCIMQNSDSQVTYQYFGIPSDIPFASAFVN